MSTLRASEAVPADRIDTRERTHAPRENPPDCWLRGRPPTIATPPSRLTTRRSSTFTSRIYPPNRSTTPTHGYFDPHLRERYPIALLFLDHVQTELYGALPDSTLWQRLGHVVSHEARILEALDERVSHLGKDVNVRCNPYHCEARR